HEAVSLQRSDVAAVGRHSDEMLPRLSTANADAACQPRIDDLVRLRTPSRPVRGRPGLVRFRVLCIIASSCFALRVLALRVNQQAISALDRELLDWMVDPAGGAPLGRALRGPDRGVELLMVGHGLPPHRATE